MSEGVCELTGERESHLLFVYETSLSDAAPEREREIVCRIYEFIL